MLLRTLQNLTSSFTRSRYETGIRPSNPAADALFGAGGKHVTVNEHTGQAYVTVGSCISNIAADIATMPYGVYRKGDGRREVMSDHPLSRLFKGKVNPYMDMFTFAELRMEDLLGWGNFVAIKEFDRRGRITALWPVRPWNVRARLVDGRDVEYDIIGSDGMQRTYTSDQVYHVKGAGSRGIWGVSVIRKHAMSIGVGMKTETGLDSLLDNGARLPGYMTMPGKLEKTARDTLKKEFSEKFGGYMNFGRVPVFDNGMEYKTISLPLHDLAFLEQAKYSDVKVAMMFRMPLYKLGIMDQAKFNNVEQMGTEYYSQTLHGHVRRIEVADGTQLFTSDEQRELYTKHNISAFLRGDTNTRFRSYDIGRRIGVYSANDILELEDRDPIEGEEGDMRIVPANMMSLEKMKDYTPGARAARTEP